MLMWSYSAVTLVGMATLYYFWPVVAAQMAVDTLGGTILGIAMSYGAAALIHVLKPASLPMIMVYEWWWIAGAITVVGALLGALYPGLTAAAHDPIEALSYE